MYTEIAPPMQKQAEYLSAEIAVVALLDKIKHPPDIIIGSAQQSRTCTAVTTPCAHPCLSLSMLVVFMLSSFQQSEAFCRKLLTLFTNYGPGKRAPVSHITKAFDQVNTRVFSRRKANSNSYCAYSHIINLLWRIFLCKHSDHFRLCQYTLGSPLQVRGQSPVSQL